MEIKPHESGVDLKTVKPTLVLCAATGMFLGVMEWLFFVTTPSFLAVFSSQQIFLSLLGTAGLYASLCMVSGLVLLFAMRPFRGRFSKLASLLPCVAPSAVLTSASLLLADNFSNTLLGFGAEDSYGIFRLFGLLLLAGCLIVYTIYCAQQVNKHPKPGFRSAAVIIAIPVIFLLIVVFGTVKYELQNEHLQRFGADFHPLNVLIFGSDGVNAEKLSLYGYERETSPFLDRLAGESIWAMNAFSNSSHTGASIISMLTGKLPFESGVIYPPDVLQNHHAYESLPAMLRSEFSYRTFQASFPKYADALDLNIINAFDVVNGRSGIEDLSSKLVSSFLGESTGLLLRTTANRLKSRLLHLSYIQTSQDVYEEVTGKASSSPQVSDKKRLSDLFDFIDQSPRPFFAHVHLMGTHGPRFRPKKPWFSKGQEQSERFMRNFYDDAVADFDRYVEETYNELARRKMLENTIFIVYSDHGMHFTTRVQLPFLIRIPGKEPEKIVRNIQNLDIPKTILHTLDIPAPAWMGGHSLFSETMDPCEPILSASVVSKKNKQLKVSFYGLPSLGILKLLSGESQYYWVLPQDKVIAYDVKYQSPPPNCPAWSENEVRQFFRKRLADAGYPENLE